MRAVTLVSIMLGGCQYMKLIFNPRSFPLNPDVKIFKRYIRLAQLKLVFKLEVAAVIDLLSNALLCH